MECLIMYILTVLNRYQFLFLKCDYVIKVDGDNQFDPKDTFKIFKIAEIIGKIPIDFLPKLSATNC